MADDVGLSATTLAAHGGVYTSTGATTYTLLKDLKIVFYTTLTVEVSYCREWT